MAEKSKFTPFAIITKPLKAVKDYVTYPKEAARRASQAAYDSYGSEEEWMGKGDAMRHMAWQALMAKKYGRVPALIAGYAHELGWGGPFGKNIDQTETELQMDLYNNALGRDIGVSSKNESEIFDKVVKEVDSGKAKYMDEHDREVYFKLQELLKGRPLD